MNLDSITNLEQIISSWPRVRRREAKSMVVFSVDNTSICWLSPNGMVQVWPPLGARSTTRRLERSGNQVRVIRQKNDQTEAVYTDPKALLTEKFSYPGFMLSDTSTREAAAIVKQAYDSVVKRYANHLPRENVEEATATPAEGRNESKLDRLMTEKLKTEKDATQAEPEELEQALKELEQIRQLQKLMVEQYGVRPEGWAAAAIREMRDERYG